MTETADQVLDMDAVCERLSMRPAEVYREIKQGELACTSKEGRTVFTEESVKAFLEQKDASSRELAQEIDEWFARLPVPAPPPSAEPEAEVREPVPEAATTAPAETPEQKQDRLVNALLAHAVSKGAADLYLDPTESGFRLLHRMPGGVRECGRFKPVLGNLIRQKLKARIGAPDPVVAPHSGAFGMTHESAIIQVKGVAAPTLLGEHIHLSFQRSMLPTSLTQIGYTEAQAEALRSALDGRSGVFLSVGPIDPLGDRHRLGLASLLAEGDRLVVSLERRPHIKSETLVQLQFGAAEGTEFSAMFQTALGMSPSVLFIDDVRTAEEAKAVFEAVAAGMCVAAHIRAADNVDALLKLLEAGVAKHAMARDILALSAQRVVRAVCPSCRKMRPASPEEAALYGLPNGADVAETAGCSECSDGFSGQCVVHDVWRSSPELAQLILALAPPADAARSFGQSSTVCLAHALREAVLRGDVLLDDAASLLRQNVAMVGTATRDEIP